MKVIVKPHEIKIELEHDYNSGEYNVQECNFEFSDEYTGLSKVVIFSNSNVTKEIQIYNDKCIVPAEVLQNEGVVGIGVYGYEVSEDELTLRYSPKPQCFPVEKGSYAEGTQPAPPTPSVVEQLQQQITNNANNISSLQDLTASQGEQIETNTNDISAIKSEQTTQNNNIQANTEEIESINGIIPTLAKKTEIPTKVSQLENDSNYVTETEMSNAIDEEKTERENADIELQSQIDAITVSPDVVDVVGTYQELLDYDTSKLTDDDIIKVLVDSTHNDALSYYRWQITGGIGSWQYVGSEGPFYTKSETNSLLNEKQDEITNDNKLDSDLVKDDGQTNKFVTAQEKNTWNNKQDALTFDNTPTKNSNNPVKSGGIYDFVNTKLEDYVLETDFEESQSLQDEEIARNKMIYNAMPKVSGEGTDLTLDNTAECPIYDIGLGPSELEQATTSISGGDEYDSPSPEHPQEIHTVSGENTIVSTSKDYLQGITLITGYVNSNDEIASATNWYHSDYIDITDYDYYIVDGNQGQLPKSIIYNANKQPIQVIDLNHNLKYTYDLKSYTGAKYLRVSSTGSSIRQQHLIAKTTYPLSLGNLEYCKIGDYEDEFMKPSGSNLYNKEISTFEGYLVNDGTEAPSANYRISDYILIEPNTSYTISNMTNPGSNPSRCYYDENKVFISGEKHFGATTIVGTSPSNARYMRESIPVVDINNVMINKGNTALPYEPYNNGKWYLKKNILKYESLDTRSWSLDSGIFYASVNVRKTDTTDIQNIYCPVYKWNGNYLRLSSASANMNNNEIATNNNGTSTNVFIRDDIFETTDDLKNYLSTNNVFAYIVLATPTYTLLSDTLQTQLDNIQKAISYQEQTNVSQTNNDLPFVIKMSAIRDLSGIFELIQ